MRVLRKDKKTKHFKDCSSDKCKMDIRSKYFTKKGDRENFVKVVKTYNKEP